MHYTELDLAEDNFFAEFEEKDEEPSEKIDQIKAPSLSKPLPSSSNFFKPHDVRAAVTSAMKNCIFDYARYI